MGKNIYDFANEKIDEEKEKLKKKIGNKNFSEMEKKIDEYQGLSNDQLAANVASEVDKLKKQGKWNKNRVESTLGQLAPFLSAEQLSSLQGIIEKLD